MPVTHWMLAHHGFLQAYAYVHYLGRDRNELEKFRYHLAHVRTVAFRDEGC